MTSTLDFRLCFVDENAWAWFSDVAPTAVWGDDWNDAPHDCNAGTPYERDGQQLVLVAFRGPYEMAGCISDGRWGYLSAQDINEGRGPWLYEPGYGTTFPEPADEIASGVTLREFIERMRAAGGEVYTVAEGAVSSVAS